MSEITNSAGPEPPPALISAPTSVSRAVTTPSNGDGDLLVAGQRFQPVDIGLRRT